MTKHIPGVTGDRCPGCVEYNSLGAFYARTMSWVENLEFNGFVLKDESGDVVAWECTPEPPEIVWAGHCDPTLYHDV